MHWQVPLIAQRTLQVCWEACGHMLWGWRYKNNPHRVASYSQQAGTYATLNRGLTEEEMDRFYHQLGIRSLRAPRGKNIRHALRWSPVIITSITEVQGHAMIVTNHSGRTYTVINPCLVQVVDFSDAGNDTCDVGVRELPAAEIERKLGPYIWYW